MLFVPCCNVAEHCGCRRRVWNMNIKLCGSFRKRHICINSRAHRQDTDVTINSCGFLRSRGIFCVSTRMQKLISMQVEVLPRLVDFKYMMHIRPPIGNMHIFFSHRIGINCFSEKCLNEVVRIKLKIMQSYLEWCHPHFCHVVVHLR